MRPPALTLFVLGLNLASLGGVAWYLRSRGDQAAVLPVLVFILSSVSVFDVYTDLRSEGLFVLAAMLTLAWFERLARTGSAGMLRVGLAGVLPLGLAVGVGLPAVRSIGVAFPAAAAAVIVMVLVRRSSVPRRWVAAAGASILGTLGYQLWWAGRAGLQGEERSYGNLLTMIDPHQPDLGRADVGDAVVRLIEQVGVQLAHGVELLTNVMPIQSFLFGVPQVVLSAVLVAGMIREFRRPNPLAAWFVMAYLGIVGLWPFDEGTRFLLPVLPLLLVFAFHGSRALIASRPVTSGGWRRVGLGTLVLGALAALETLLRSSGTLQGLAWVGIWVLLSAGAFWWARRDPRPSAFVPWRPATAVWVIVVAHLLVGGPTLVGQAARQRAGEQQFNTRQIAGAIPWILARSDSSDVLAATVGAQGMHLHTSRLVRSMPTTGDPDRLWSVLDESEARFLVVPDAHEYPYLLPTGPERLGILERARPGRLELVHTYSMGRIFEIRPP
jgi:hypothetical protein